MPVKIGGVSFYLTKHGLKRYRQRVGKYKTEAEILQHCTEGLGEFEPIWESHWSKKGFALVSVVPRGKPRKLYF
jgi:hypothetical protein